MIAGSLPNGRGTPAPAITLAPRLRLHGLTLVETLVTFVILGFLTTLILQAVGFFAARYDGVQRVHRVAALESLRQNWFATSVQGFVPYGVVARRFKGNQASFVGITLEPLDAEPGTPVTAHWSIEEGTVRYAESLAAGVPGIEWTVLHSDPNVRPQRRPEWDTPNFGLNGDIEMPSPPGHPTGDEEITFQYADAFANWYDHWPPRPGASPQPDALAPQSDEELIDALAATINAAPDDPLSDPANDWTPRLIRLFSTTEGTIWLARVEPSARPLLTDADVE